MPSRTPIYPHFRYPRATICAATDSKSGSRGAYYLGEINAIHPFRDGTTHSVMRMDGCSADNTGLEQVLKKAPPHRTEQAT